MDDTVNGGESYPRSFKRFGRVKTLEYAKQLVGILHIKTDSIVSNEHHRLIVPSIGASYRDLRLRACACELDRIGNEIDECKSQHRAVAVHVGQCANRPRNIAPVCLRPAFM